MPVPDEYSGKPFADAPDQAEQREETDENEDETGHETECRTELSLSGEGSPDQNDPGEERKEEAEEIFFAQ
ncbi:hypothetical protein [Pontiella desulfatans]|uniref:hypothetical protein n=1 Tax=Pontiella desulfatans TaxID=2750659 RepID=UPI00109D2D89|nr:hypothetical protein [Pontiella desulfatans]